MPSHTEPPAAGRRSWPLVAVTDGASAEETSQGRWEIRAYSKIEKERSVFISSPPMVEVCGARFYLVVYFKGDEKSADGRYAVYLGRVYDAGPDARTVTCQVSVVLEGKSGYRYERTGRPNNEFPPQSTEGSGWYNFGLIDELESSDFLVDDTVVFGLQVTARVTGAGAPVPRTWSLPAAPTKVPGTAVAAGGADDRKRRKVTVAGDLAAFLAGGQATDVELVGDGLDDKGEHAVKAHRVVLAARSPVFNRMLLESGMSESKADAKISLEGVDCAIVRRFVNFLYADELGQESLDCPDTLCHLFSLAHRYEVHSLQDLCVARLTVTIAADNALERLMLAEQFGISTLKEQAMGFLCNERKLLMKSQKTDAFARMTKSHPQLMAELFVKALQDRQE